jgi:hypothetical protein
MAIKKNVCIFVFENKLVKNILAITGFGFWDFGN